MSLTHNDLVALAATWLRRDCAVVVTELTTIGEVPDAIGWHGPHSKLVECKASYADFRTDAGKWFRRRPECGMGQRRFYLAPAGVIPADELPAGWGLLEVQGRRIRQQRESDVHKANARAEIGLLLSAIRRIGQTAPQGMSVKFYTMETQCTATLGVAPPEPQEVTA
jgi:hypothetical protein